MAMQDPHSAGTFPLAHLQTTRQFATPRIRSARSRNRAAAWAHDAAQWRLYQLAQHPDASEAIEAEYARLAEGGPDFAHYHVGSSFAEPPLHSITREDRIRVLQTFDLIRTGLYRHGRQPRAQAVSRNYRDVLGVLLSYAVKRGRCFPAIATIAAAAMCSRTTVFRAIAWLRLFGFLERIRRLARVRTPLGLMSTRQTSNAYKLNVSLSGLSALALSAFRNGPSATTRLHHLTQTFAMKCSEQKRINSYPGSP
jgi:Helix-turn-helix domain